jgi:cytochrome c biogenesis protein CcmG, thiol:disulfide interchange protein DsbE
VSEPHPSRRLVRQVLASAAVSTLLLAGLLAWVLTSAAAPEPDREEVRVSGAAPAAPLPARTPPPGTRAPALRLPTLDGGTVDLAGLRGRPVVVNFWAPDCAPCRTEFPLLRDADHEHAAAGLALVGVTVRGSAADARAFADQHHAGWTLAMDHGQRAAAGWQVAGIPQTFFIRADGTIASHQLGELDAASLNRQLAAILPATTPSR